ncbi:hypothetical protein Bpfe_028590 [Biomphalaria pfeifferi]|uniref:Uncharacterized protein n=1 Tax=Biomphalaria pfeifferi TaxID=112525 RepID=A0AAD8EVZ3_BIOPF|nr:hypothetical protein Bpfe_028590 [Biomphalaria pfeifferi]
MFYWPCLLELHFYSAADLQWEVALCGSEFDMAVEKWPTTSRHLTSEVVQNEGRHSLVTGYPARYSEMKLNSGRG